MLKCARFVVPIHVGMIAVLLTVAPCLLLAQQPPISPDVYGQLKYRYIGPEGNRATSVAGVPGRPNIWYVGAASGGIFKSSDGGIHWDPIFDSQPVASIGSLAAAASDPNIVWAGTGESFIRSHISVGQGIYKSMDAGATWSLMGLEKAGRSRNAASSAPPTAERPGIKSFSSTRTRAAPTWAWIPTIRESFLQGCGRSRFTHGAGRAAGRAAACSS